MKKTKLIFFPVAFISITAVSFFVISDYSKESENRILMNKIIISAYQYKEKCGDFPVSPIINTDDPGFDCKSISNIKNPWGYDYKMFFSPNELRVETEDKFNVYVKREKAEITKWRKSAF